MVKKKALQVVVDSASDSAVPTPFVSKIRVLNIVGGNLVPSSVEFSLEKSSSERKDKNYLISGSNEFMNYKATNFSEGLLNQMQFR